jgi:hypothetical protein
VTVRAPSDVTRPGIIGKRKKAPDVSGSVPALPADGMRSPLVWAALVLGFALGVFLSDWI